MVAALAALDLKQASHWFKVRVPVCPAPPALVRPVRLFSGGGTCRWRLFVADGGHLHSCLPHLDWLKCSISKHPQPSRRPRQPISAQLSSPNTKCTAHDSLMRGTNRDRPTRQHGRPSASPPQPHATLLRARQVLLGADLAESRFQKHSLNPTSLRPSSIYRRPDLARHPANVVLGARRPSPSFPATTHRFDDGDPRNKCQSTTWEIGRPDKHKAWRSPCPPRSAGVSTIHTRVSAGGPVAGGWTAGKWTVGAREARHQGRHLANPISP